MYSDVKTIRKCVRVKSDAAWDQAIKDAEELLKQVEFRAERIRGAIRTFMDCREAGEPYSQSRDLKQSL